ncbi:hypothetical protein JCM19000A_14360 [Silvimonas sp. JCM 19000]
MHFPEIYSGEGELIVPNIALMSISVFDHWLSEEEAGSCRFMNFKVALGQDAEDDYIIGEKRFLDFYSSLAVDGVVLNSDAQPEFMRNDDCRLQTVFLESLREKRLMDAYFVANQVRVVGGYDRTDLLILADQRYRAEIEVMAQNCGLFVLHARA